MRENRGAFVLGPRKIAIGDHTLVNPRRVPDGRMGVTVGDNVDIAMDVQILTLGHDVNTPAISPTAAPLRSANLPRVGQEAADIPVSILDG